MMLIEKLSAIRLYQGDVKEVLQNEYLNTALELMGFAIGLNTHGEQRVNFYYKERT